MRIKVAKMNLLDELINNFNDLMKESDDIPSKNECGEEPIECSKDCEHVTKNVIDNSEGIELTDDVYMLNENYFMLANKVSDINITDNTNLVFGYLNGERYVPGITEEQLLTVLLYRNRNDKKRYDLIKQLLFN